MDGERNPPLPPARKDKNKAQTRKLMAVTENSPIIQLEEGLKS